MPYFRTLAFLGLPVLGGCGVFECLDAQFERDPKPIQQVFVVELALDGTRHHQVIQCEEYYDAMCSERGNYWTSRRTGTQSRNDDGHFNVAHERLGPLSISVPSCADMTSRRQTPLANLIFFAEGNNRYLLIRSDGELRTYRAWDHGSKPGDILQIPLSMSVNGESLE